MEEAWKYDQGLLSWNSRALRALSRRSGWFLGEHFPLA